MAKRKRLKTITRVSSSNIVKNYKLSKDNTISYLTKLNFFSHERVAVKVN